MKPADQPILSTSIVKLIEHAITGKSKAVNVLRERVWASVFDICDAIEEDDTIKQMVRDYLATNELSKGRLAKLRKFLRQQV